MPRMPHVLLNRLTAKPGQRQRVVEILLESGKLFDDNPACLLYLVSESTDDPNLVWVVDLWTSQEAHAEALEAPELRPFVEQAVPLLEGMPEQIEVRPVGARACQAEVPRSDSWRLSSGDASPRAAAPLRSCGQARLPWAAPDRYGGSRPTVKPAEARRSGDPGLGRASGPPPNPAAVAPPALWLYGTADREVPVGLSVALLNTLREQGEGIHHRHLPRRTARPAGFS